MSRNCIQEQFIPRAFQHVPLYFYVYCYTVVAQGYLWVSSQALAQGPPRLSEFTQYH